MDDRTPTHEPHDPVQHAMPARTTPTWEMELLISGVTVFALLQVPGLLDGWLDRMLTLQSESLMMLALLAAVYSKAAAITLALTFVVHLGLRAYWIGLVGTRSVYPEGVRWDALTNFPPHTLRRLREKLRSMDELVERADDRASLLFANGVALAFAMIVPMVSVIVAAMVSVAIVTATGWRDAWPYIFLGLSALLFLPLIVTSVIDKSAGARIAPESRGGRALHRVLRIYEWFGMSRASNPILLLSSSQVGFRRAQYMATFVIFAVMGTVIADVMLRLRVWKYERYEALPALESGSARVFDPQHYASSRDGHLSTSTTPFIQSDVVTGDYVRLFVPFRTRRHARALADLCPDVSIEPHAERAAEAARADAMAACLARVHVATLDGAKLPPLDFVFTTDPATSVRGMLAMIPVRDLAPGRHVLTLERAQRPPPAEPEPAFAIPFWR